MRPTNRPDETKQYSNATVYLYRKCVRIRDQERDRMFIEELQTGHEDDVFIFEQNGERRVASIGMVMELTAGSWPHVPVTSDMRSVPQPITDDAKVKRFLAR